MLDKAATERLRIYREHLYKTSNGGTVRVVIEPPFVALLILMMDRVIEESEVSKGKHRGNIITLPKRIKPPASPPPDEKEPA